MRRGNGPCHIQLFLAILVDHHGCNIVSNDPLHKVDVPVEYRGDPKDANQIKDDVEVRSTTSVGGCPQRSKVGRDGRTDVFAQNQRSRSLKFFKSYLLT